MDRSEIIRTNIKYAITRSKLSRLKVSERAGISYNHLTRFLNNNSDEIGLGILLKISGVLNVPLSYLVGESDITGDFFTYTDELHMPKKWSEIIYRILTFPEEQQSMIYKIVSASVDAINASVHKAE